MQTRIQAYMGKQGNDVINFKHFSFEPTTWSQLYPVNHLFKSNPKPLGHRCIILFSYEQWFLQETKTEFLKTVQLLYGYEF